MTTITSTDLRNKSIGLYTPPFRFEHGYIWDAKGQMVADNHVDGEDAVLRVRGWGRICYMENPEALQDEVGNVIALAMTEFWERRKAEKDSEPVFILEVACADYKGQKLGNHFGFITLDAARELKEGNYQLYAAQPVPVVMDDTKLRELFDSWFASDCSFDLSPEASEEDNIAWRESYWYVWQRCRAAMLQAGTLTNEDTKQAWTGIPDIDNAINMLDRIDTLESCDDDRIEAVKTVLRRLAGSSPVIPDGYVMVPKEPTERMVIDGFESEPDETFSEPEVWEAYEAMSGCGQAHYRARLCWAAMISAAPKQENI